MLRPPFAHPQRVSLTMRHALLLSVFVVAFAPVLPLRAQVTFTTPGDHSFEIPTTGTLTVALRGADGGNGGTTGGTGATLTETFAAQAGDVLTVVVGGAGGKGDVSGGGGGGYHGGDGGSEYSGYHYGRGGSSFLADGASDVTRTDGTTGGGSGRDGEVTLSGPATVPDPQTFVVTKAEDTDDGTCDVADCSLREAIAAANASTGSSDPDRITFDASLAGATIALEHGQLTITDDVEIDGEEGLGGAGVTVDAQGNSRVLSVASGVGATLIGLTVTGGSADYGGGILHDGDALTLLRSTVAGNQATFSGGGLGSIAGGNTGALTIEQSTFSANTASQGAGLVFRGSRPLIVRTSTFSGNEASAGGSAMLTTQPVQIENTTITGNETSTLRTIQVLQAAVTLRNTIVAGNSGGELDCGVSFGGSIASLGHNIVETGRGCPSDGTGDVAVDAADVFTTVLEETLADHGGPTLTHALLAGSPAVDLGGTCGPTDQRGEAAPADGDGDTVAACDAGAVEGLVSASIGDFVWNDLNGDGLQEGGEPGLSGVTVYLDLNDSETLDGDEPSDVTDGDGAYDITTLPAGSYSVRVDATTVPAGFVLTTANEPLAVELTSGEDYNDADFGYRLPPPQTFVVTKAEDTDDGMCDADCSLREAIAAADANAAAEPDTITFVPGLSGGTILLGSDLALGSNAVIDGSVLDEPVTVDGGGSFMPLRIDGSVTEAVVQRLIFTNSHAETVGVWGAGIVFDEVSVVDAGAQGIIVYQPGELTFLNGSITGDIINALSVVGKATVVNTTLFTSRPVAALVTTSIASSSASLTNVTLVSMGSYNVGHEAGSLRIDNSILIGGRCYGAVTGSNNLDETGTCAGFTDPVVGSAALGPVATAANGTQYFPLTSTSAALEAGDGTRLDEATVGADLNGDGDQADVIDTDQLGAARVLDGDGDGTAAVDLGAYEAPVPTASIGDFVWNDLDGDGLQEGGEPGLSGVTVYLDLNGNEALDGGEPSDVTDSAGAYDFTSLATGTYSVMVDETTVPADFVLTTANAPLVVNLAAGEDYNDADFGYRLPTTTLSVTLADAFALDLAPTGSANAFDRLTYTATITNTGSAAALDAVFTLTPDALTPLEAGSVTTTVGTVTTGNTGGDTSVEVALGLLGAGAEATVTFTVVVGDLPGDTEAVSNQGTATAANAPEVQSDDPDTAEADDATATPAAPIRAIAVTGPREKTLFHGQTYNITWTSQYIGASQVRIQLLRSDVSPAVWTDLAAATDNDGSFQWTVPGDIAQAAAYRLVVSAVDYPETFGFTQLLLITPVQSLALTSPDGRGESWVHGETVTIEWESSASMPATNQVELWLLSSTKPRTIQQITASTDNDGSFEWLVPADVPVGEAVVQIQHTVNRQARDRSRRFFVTDEPISITVTSPTAATVWQAGQVEEITWTSTGLQPTSPIRIQLRDLAAAGRTIVVTGTENDGVFEWPVPVDLPAGSTYEVGVESPVSALAAGSSPLFEIASAAPPRQASGEGEEPALTLEALVLSRIDLEADREAQALFVESLAWEEVLEEGAPSGELPSAYGLSGSYPNPFNPQAVIEYALPEGAEVRLAVYDALGREVAVLVDGRLEAGIHRAVFEAGGLPSGVYLYRLETPAGVFTGTATLVK